MFFALCVGGLLTCSVLLRLGLLLIVFDFIGFIVQLPLIIVIIIMIIVIVVVVIIIIRRTIIYNNNLFIGVLALSLVLGYQRAAVALLEEGAPGAAAEHTYIYIYIYIQYNLCICIYIYIYMYICSS